MRISTQQQYNISIQRMQNSNTTIGQLQRQISTGKQLHQPSDNPAVAAEVVRLNREIAAMERYDGNMDIAQTRLELEETNLDSINTQMDRLRELTISANSGTKNTANLQTIATEVREIVESMAGTMNRQDAQGEYIYSGSMGFTKPYELNSEGYWEYQGDNGQREIQIGATHYVASNDSGQYLFENVEGELQYGHQGSSFVDDSRFSFADDAAEEEWEAWVKENVQGDLHFRKRVEIADTATPGSAAYSFEIVDSAGTVHYPDPATVATPLTGEAQMFDFNGLTISLDALETADYEFPEQGSRGGVDKITVTDQAAMDQFFEDYGDVTVKFNAAGPDYQLESARTGELIELNEATTFTMPAQGQIQFGGLTLDVDGADGDFVLSKPSQNNSITEIGSLDGASVHDAATFETFMQDDPDAALPAGHPDKGAAPAPPIEKIELRITNVTSPAGDVTYDIVDQNGDTLLAAPVTVAGASLTAGDLVDPTTGLTFSHGGNLEDGDSYTLTLREDAPNPADPKVVVAYAESTVTMDYEQLNILNIGLQLAEQLEKGNDSQALQDELSKVLEETLGYITEAQDRITEAVTGVGARLSAMEDTRVANEDIKLFTRTTLSAIEDADLPAVASQLKLEEILLQASQQTFASVSQLSLFNYIN